MYTPACVSPGPRPSSWTGKAGAGPFSVDGTFGGEGRNCFHGGNEGRDDPEASDTAVWRKLKQRLKAEGNEIVTICNGLKMRAADGIYFVQALYGNQ